MAARKRKRRRRLIKRYPRAAVHLKSLQSNSREVERLLEIHTLIAGAGPGHKHDVEVLNKSALVLLVACWEAYVEDLADAAFRHLLVRAASPDVIPAKVRSLAARPLMKDPDDRAVWKLADDGWRDVLNSHAEDVLKRYTGKLNTPKSEQVDKLFLELIGMPKVSSHWHWKGQTADGARRRLDAMITARGAVAHRVAAAKAVRKAYIDKCQSLVWRLAVITHNRVNAYLKPPTGVFPWHPYNYGSTH